MEEKRKSERVKNMLCFVPFFAPIIYSVEKNKSDRLTKNITYAIILLVLYIILLILPFIPAWLTSILYLFMSGFLGYKAYLGEDVDFEFIDDFLKKNQK